MNRLFATLILLGVCALGQEGEHTPVPVYTLHEVETNPTTSQVFAFWNTPRCEEDGSMYFRIDNGDFNTSPIWKVNQEGEKKKSFQLPSRYADVYSIYNYDVSNGRVYEIVGTAGDGTHVVRFDQDGSISADIKLESPEHMEADHIVALATGGFFVSGAFNSDAPKAKQKLRFAAFFDSRGALLKEISSSSQYTDDELQTPAETLDSGDAIASPDGGVFVLTSSRVLRVLPDGSVSKLFMFGRLPDHAAARKLEYSKGVFSVQFAQASRKKPLSVWFRTFTLSGEPIAEYRPEPTLGNTPLCFSPNEGYTFWTSNHGTNVFMRGWIR